MKETIVVLHQGIDSRRKDLTIDNACQVRDNLLISLAGLGYKGISVFLDDRFEWAQRILDAKPDLVANVADLGFFYVTGGRRSAMRIHIVDRIWRTFGIGKS